MLSEVSIEACTVPVADGHIMTVLAAPSRVRGALLIAPPLLNELHCSYPLFARIARELAERSIAVLRFDYRGCGDSSGIAATLRLDAMREDADTALAQLSMRYGITPAVLGVRMGSLVVQSLCKSKALRFAAWQPIADGAEWLAATDALTLAQINDLPRYPFLRHKRKPMPLEFAGERVSTAFRGDMAATTLRYAPEWVLDNSARLPANGYALPTRLHAWIEKLDLTTMASGSEISEVAGAISSWVLQEAQWNAS